MRYLYIFCINAHFIRLQQRLSCSRKRISGHCGTMISGHWGRSDGQVKKFCSSVMAPQT